jgi:hypothetical protein
MNNLLEVAAYLGLVALGALVYVLVMKYGIPWYYCTYHYICF